ncbi:MAG: hypothetical protein K2I10_02865 [Lachnospiraceae bacterium]|nr:hypothetical protein [Lachnospiraceae bacterium]
MRRLKNRTAGLLKKTAAIFICGVLLTSAPLGAGKVNATESGTESAETKVADSSNNDNVDANGKLGKNSDVGIELSKSITGKAGKKVKIEFKLISNNTSAVKVKSVYPVIDNTFPFETSGDAYKVISAGDDEKQQKSMDASFEMQARSDITTGYHSVRFIGEYTKIAEDGSSEDFYIIKTINIYFTSSSDSSGGGTSGGTSPGSSGGNSGGSSGSSYDDDDDDDDDYSYSGGSGGGSSGSSSDEATAPKLIIKGYDTKPKKIMAGEKFTLTIHIQNTSKSTSLCNGKFLIGNEAGNFLPTSGSSAVYVEKIEAGKTGDLKIEMKTSADLAQKNYILVVKGDFDDGKGNNFTSSDNLSIPVYQEVKLGVTDVSMSPEQLAVGAEGSLMFTINNKGTAGVYNVNVSVKDDAVSCDDNYVGNIAGSSSAYATLNLVAQKDNSETGTIKVEISYEDSEGNKGKMEEQIACYVGDDVEMAEINDEFMGDDDEEDDSGSLNWLIIALVIVILAAIAGVIVFIVMKKKKRMAELLADDDDDFDDSDDISDNISDKDAPDVIIDNDGSNISYNDSGDSGNEGEDDIENEDF